MATPRAAPRRVRKTESSSAARAPRCPVLQHGAAVGNRPLRRGARTDRRRKPAYEDDSNRRRRANRGEPVSIIGRGALRSSGAAVLRVDGTGGPRGYSARPFGLATQIVPVMRPACSWGAPMSLPDVPSARAVRSWQLRWHLTTMMCSFTPTLHTLNALYRRRTEHSRARFPNGRDGAARSRTARVSSCARSSAPTSRTGAAWRRRTAERSWGVGPKSTVCQRFSGQPLQWTLTTPLPAPSRQENIRTSRCPVHTRPEPFTADAQV